MNNTDSAWEAVRNAAIGAENYKRARRDANIDLFSRAAANAAHYAISKSILKETEDDLRLLNTDLEKERPVAPEEPQRATLSDIPTQEFGVRGIKTVDFSENPNTVSEGEEYTVQQDPSNTNDTVSAWDAYTRTWKKQPVDRKQRVERMIDDTLNDIDKGRYNDYEQRRKEYDEQMKKWNARFERQKELEKKGRVGILEDSALRLAMHNPDWSARMSQKAENERQREMQYDKFRLEHAKEFAKSALAIISNDSLLKALRPAETYQDQQHNAAVNEELSERRKEAMAYAPQKFEDEKTSIDNDVAFFNKLEDMLPMKDGKPDLDKIGKMSATEKSQLFKAYSEMARLDPNTGYSYIARAPGVFGYIQSLWNALKGAVIGKQNVTADDIDKGSKNARKDLEARKKAFNDKWEERKERGRDKWSYRVQQGFDALMDEFKYEMDEPGEPAPKVPVPTPVEETVTSPATNNAATNNTASVKAKIEATDIFKKMDNGDTETITLDDGKSYKVTKKKGKAIF